MKIHLLNGISHFPLKYGIDSHELKKITNLKLFKEWFSNEAFNNLNYSNNRILYISINRKYSTTNMLHNQQEIDKKNKSTVNKNIQNDLIKQENSFSIETKSSSTNIMEKNEDQISQASNTLLNAESSNPITTSENISKISIPNTDASKSERMEFISKLDTDPDRSASRYALKKSNEEFSRKIVTNALLKTNEALPPDIAKVGTNKLAQALAYDIMSRDVESNLIKYTSFEDKPGKLHLAHNYFGVFLWLVFFLIVVGYAIFEMYRSAVYGREYPEMWGHVPIPWNDDEKIKEYPQSMWPWQKDHPWQKNKRTMEEFENLKKKMKESGEL